MLTDRLAGGLRDDFLLGSTELVVEVVPVAKDLRRADWIESDMTKPSGKPSREMSSDGRRMGSMTMVFDPRASMMDSGSIETSMNCFSREWWAEHFEVSRRAIEPSRVKRTLSTAFSVSLSLVVNFVVGE